MLVGSFHSGPLSTIKYIGIVGLVLYYSLLCYMAYAAWRMCIRARNTKAFSLALFISIPIIYEPFNFLIIFGALENNYPQTLLWAGLLTMCNRYINVCEQSLTKSTFKPARIDSEMVLERA